MANIKWGVSDQWSAKTEPVQRRAPRLIGFASAVHKFTGAGLTLGVIVIIASAVLAAISVGRSVAGGPLILNVSGNWANIPAGGYDALPLSVHLFVIAIAGSISFAVSRLFSRPATEIRTFDKNAWWRAIVALALLPVAFVLVQQGCLFVVNEVVPSAFPGIINMLYPAEPLRVTVT